MNSIERGLRQEIPFEAAAEFFLKIKHGHAPEEKIASRDISVVRSRIKKANMGMAPATPGPLLPTGMGKNMSPPAMTPLPPTAMGQNKVASHSEDVGKDRAHKALHQKFEKHENTKGERALGNLGGLAGAAAGGYAGHKFGKSPHATAAGMLTGFALGKAHGKSVGTSLDVKSFKKKQAALKQAFDEMFGEEQAPAGSVMDPVNMRQYMAMEEMGQAAEEEGHAEFLRERLQTALAELQAAKDMASTSQQNSEMLQQQQAMHEQQLTAAQQSSQLATQAAMQNVQQAHELALKATSQALQAKDDAINTHQLAAQMRMAYQDMRGSIMDAVAQDAAAPIGEAIKAQGAAAQSVPPGGAPGEAPPTEGGGEEAGAEGEAGKEGAGADPHNVNKDMQPQEQAGGPESPPAAAAPNSLAPSSGGPEHANQANAEAGSGTSPFDGKDPKPNLQVGTQAQPGVGGSAKQAHVKLGGLWGQAFQSALGHLKDNAGYAAAGGALGAALPFVESHVGHDDLRAKVKGMGESGTKGFGQTLDLAQSKIRLALGEISEKHPGAASVAGGVMGAAAGAALGPHIMEGFKALPGRLKELRGGADQ